MTTDIHQNPDVPILEIGWQGRLKDAIKRGGDVDLEIFRMKVLIRRARAGAGILIVNGGMLRDTILMAAALWEERKEGKESKVTLQRDALIAAQSVDDTIAAAYGISAMTDPDHQLGNYIGYSTGQGQDKGAHTRMVATTAGSLSRHLLNGRVRREDVGAVIVDRADSGSVYNQLLLSGLKELHDNDAAPLIILLSGHPERTRTMAAFFQVRTVDWHIISVGEERDGESVLIERLHLPLPKHINYEQAREPHHINQTRRAVDILAQILRGETHPNSQVIVFTQNEGMSARIMQQLEWELRGVFMAGSATDTAETQTHRIHILSRDLPIERRLSLELGKAGEQKPRIIISSLPADMLGIVSKFDVVIDTHRSRQGGGYYSIPTHEADRRASYATPEGTCYRLTTESEYRHPRYADAESADEFVLSEEKEDEFNDTVQTAGKDPNSFPHTFIHRGYRSSARKESAPREPAIEQWVTQIGVEPHVARLVEAYKQQGQLDIGLAIAACTRESHIIRSDVSPHLLAEDCGLPYSDILLRTKGLGCLYKTLSALLG